MHWKKACLRNESASDLSAQHNVQLTRAVSFLKGTFVPGRVARTGE